MKVLSRVKLKQTPQADPKARLLPTENTFSPFRCHYKPHLTISHLIQRCCWISSARRSTPTRRDETQGYLVVCQGRETLSRILNPRGVRRERPPQTEQP